MKNKLIIFFALCLAMASCNTDPELGFAEFERVTVSEISDTEAKINWSIIKKGDLHNAPSIDNLFICYSASNNKPTINDHYFISQNNYHYGIHDAKLTGLTPGTKYYVRISLDGKLYSDVVTFTTTGQNPNPSVDPTPNPSVDPSENPSIIITEVNSVEFQARSGYNEWTNPEWLQISGTVLYIVNEAYGNLLLIDDYGIVPVYGVTATIQKDQVNDQSFSSLGIERGAHITICGTKKTYKGVNELFCAYFVSKDSYTSDYIIPPATIENSLTLLPQDFSGGTKKYELEKNENGCWFGVKCDSWSLWLLIYYQNESSTSVIPYGTYNINGTSLYGTAFVGTGYSRRDNAFYGSYAWTNTNDVTTCNLLFLRSGTVTVSAGTSYGQKISINAVSSGNQPLNINYQVDNIVLKNCVVSNGSFYAPRKPQK